MVCFPMIAVILLSYMCPCVGIVWRKVAAIHTSLFMAEGKSTESQSHFLKLSNSNLAVLMTMMKLWNIKRYFSIDFFILIVSLMWLCDSSFDFSLTF